MRHRAREGEGERDRKLRERLHDADMAERVGCEGNSLDGPAPTGGEGGTTSGWG